MGLVHFSKCSKIGERRGGGALEKRDANNKQNAPQIQDNAQINYIY